MNMINVYKTNQSTAKNVQSYGTLMTWKDYMRQIKVWQGKFTDHHRGQSIRIFQYDARPHNNRPSKNIHVQVQRKNTYRIAIRHECFRENTHHWAPIQCKQRHKKITQGFHPTFQHIAKLLH